MKPASARLTVAIAAAVLAVASLPTMGVLAQSPSASTDPAAATELSGTWTVDPSIGSFDYAAEDFSGSWVGYRVQEELVGVGGAVAVGRTPDVVGSLTLDGTAITSTEMTADLTTLQSDQSMRDGQLGEQGVQTDLFPTATFVLTEPIELGTVPAEGEEVTATAVGDLTLHGVTRTVSIPLGAVWSGDVIGVAGSLTFRWEDFGMERPQSMRVVSLAEEATMEFQVFFRKDAAAAG
jgi:polyisoprenoid-binding protein YceI